MKYSKHLYQGSGFIGRYDKSLMYVILYRTILSIIQNVEIQLNHYSPPIIIVFSFLSYGIPGT